MDKLKNQALVYVIGIGPGSENQMTIYAREVLEICDVIIGYDTYIDLIQHLLKPQQEIIRAGMTEEVYRAQKAVELAYGNNEQGKTVGVISSGDSGLYGMAGLIYEVLDKMNLSSGVKVEVVPGVTALISAASLLGSPVMHDFCAISLSDHLTPWNTIEERLEYASRADFVIALYNPKSGRRKEQIVRARDILMKYRSPDNPAGIVTAAYREDQNVVITDLDHLLDHEMGMMTTIIIGNSTTNVINGKMITPRGYHKKYDLDKVEQPIKLTERLNSKHEPWSFKNTEKNSAVNKPGKEIQLFQESSSPSSVLVKYFIQTKEFTNHTGADSERIVSLSALARISGFLSQESRIETTPDGRLFIICHEIDRQTQKELAQTGLHLYEDEDLATLKKCNFCDGEKTQSLPWLEKLNALLAQTKVPGQLHIGFNGCGRACHGAVMEDIGIVYFRGEFEVYTGGKRVGRNVRLPMQSCLHLSGDEMLSQVESLLKRYQKEAFEGEKFFKYILRMSEQTA